jgi:phosphatidate cytidylyltransferase
VNNIIVRTLSGIVFISIIIGSILLGTSYLNTCMALFSLLGFYEFTQLLKKKEVELATFPLLLLGLILFFILIRYNGISLPLKLLLLILIFIISWSIEIWQKQGNPLLNVVYSSFGLLYCVLPFVTMAWINSLRGDLYGSNYLLIYFFLIVWTNDTFAYLAGRFFGKTKLFERISPKKTWEGAFGGLLFSAIAGFLIAYFTGLDSVFWIIASQIIALGAVIGDLFESLIKRSLNAKDSGNIIPGHGGILDRFDAAMFAAPLFLVWFYLYHFIIS